MSKYIRVTKHLQDKGKLFTPSEFEEFLKTKKETDYYYSTFYYNDKHKEIFDKTGSVKGITDVKGDTLYFDFDAEPTEFEQVRSDAKTLVARLRKENINEENYKIFYSGSKGIHLQLKLDREYNPVQLQHLALEYYGKGLKTLDPRVYNPSRVLRLPYSKHQDTGVYKQQMSEAQLNALSIETIKASFASDCKVKPITLKPVTINESNLPKEELKIATKKQVSSMGERPKHWLEYKWALLNAQGLLAGERDHAMMIVAATCRGLGYNREISESFLNYFDSKYASSTNQDQNPEQVEEKLDNVFQEGWQGGTYTFKNDPWLRDYCKRLNIKVVAGREDKILRIGDVNEGFAEYIKNIEQNTIKTGIRVLDEEMPLTTGSNLGILGAPSSGKTALALSILKHTSKMGNISVMASLDMHRNRLFEKLLLKESNYGRKDLYEAYKSGKVDKVIERIKEDYSNVWFYDRSSPTIDDIRSYVERIQEETGKKVKLVMIDYFERVGAEKSDDTAASKEVSGKIQDMLNDLDVCVVTLVQPNKMAIGGGPDTPILSYNSIKGSSFLAQSFRSIISIWRPFFNPQTREQDKFMSMAILKNDLGEVNQFDFNWVGKTGSITEMSDEDRNTLEMWLKEKNGKNAEGWD